MHLNTVSKAGALMCILIQLSVAATAALVATPPAKREIGWWFYCPASADDPGVDGALKWVTEHKNIVSTIMMHCGIYTCAVNHSAPRGGNFSCLNNGGIGGQVTGELAESGKKLLPEFTKLGVKVELWLGEDDSRQSALHMFQNPDKIASDLIAIAKDYPGITGFNLDTETAHSTAHDAQLSVPFLKRVTQTLAAAPGGPLRFSTDVACSGGAGWCPMISDCTLLANSGVGKIMNMGTYNSPGFASWYQTELTPALNPAIPKARIGAGLGVWNDSRTAHTWNLTPKSAEDRICALMNHSFQELDMFVLRQGSTDPTKNFPYDFWVKQLERFMAGGGCPLPAGTTLSCPTDAWKPGGDPGCCTSHYDRPNGHGCNEVCAKAECEAAGAKPGESWWWKPENYSSHPYECCNKSVPPASMRGARRHRPSISDLMELY